MADGYDWIDDAIQVGGTIYGATQTADAAGDAANAQTGASREALELMREMWETGRADQMPWLQGGQQGLSALLKTYGLGTPNGQPDYSGFENDPSYLWTQEQGQKGIDRSAAARGSLYSGGTDADRMAYSQGLAAQQLGNYRSGLAGIAGVGQATAGNLASQGQQFGQQAGQQYGNIGNAQAQGIYGRQSAYNQGINQLAQWYGYNG
jgi:hypothetical protein